MNLLNLSLIACLISFVVAGNRRVKREFPHYEQPIPEDVTIFKCENAVKPKVVIVSLFAPETFIWHRYIDFVHNITVPGLSPLFPFVYCTEDHQICQVVTGEGEINAASTITAFVTSPLFDLSQSYFLVAGIAGINPYQGTLGSVSFSRFAISIGLQNEIDGREIPDNWRTGYFAFNSDGPEDYPRVFYGTEVFEINEKLRDRAAELAQNVTLVDEEIPRLFREKYDYSPANEPPSVIKCDVTTSDSYFTGHLLSESFGNITKLFTNGTGEYCMTAQEDTAVLESILRGSRFGLVDFSRLVIMRTGADFDRPPPQLNATQFFLEVNQGAVGIALKNIYKAGNPFVQDVVNNWDTLYADGKTYAPTNYIGDVFGYLGGNPDFGFGSYLKHNYLQN